MITIISGGRDFQDKALFKEAMDQYGSSITELICGMEIGADMMGKDWAIEQGIPILECPAEWMKYGKAAGPRKNFAMTRAADQLIAFFDGRSRGTDLLIDTATQGKLVVHIFKY